MYNLKYDFMKNLSRNFNVKLDSKDLDALCANCSLTEWSLWSPCNVSCGPGQRERSRDRIGTTDGCDSRCFIQRINCMDNPSCESNMQTG